MSARRPAGKGGSDVKVKGYKVAADLEGTTLTATADGKVGRAALGTDERAIDLTQVEAVSFERAGMMKNGSLVLVDARGKTHLHFRKKDNDAWKALYDAVTGLVPSGALVGSTKGAGLVHEDIDQWHDQKLADLERMKAEREASEVDRASASSTPASSTPAGCSASSASPTGRTNSTRFQGGRPTRAHSATTSSTLRPKSPTASLTDAGSWQSSRASPTTRRIRRPSLSMRRAAESSAT
jgi:hypothetical protein